MVMKLRKTPVINLNTPLAIAILTRVRHCWYTVQLHVHASMKRQCTTERDTNGYAACKGRYRALT